MLFLGGGGVVDIYMKVNSYTDSYSALLLKNSRLIKWAINELINIAVNRHSDHKSTEICELSAQ